MKLARNYDRSWAVVDDEDSVLVSGLRTHAAVQRWIERQDVKDHDALRNAVVRAAADGLPDQRLA
jgi:hypothetical protein